MAVTRGERSFSKKKLGGVGLAVNLITDRTQNDVAYWSDLRQMIIERTASVEQWREWRTGTKGSYNATDLNRVGIAVKEIGNIITELYSPVIVNPKTNWTISDIPTPTQMQNYLNDIESVRSSVASVLISIPSTPSSMDYLTYGLANDIEQILLDAVTFVEQIRSVFLQSNNAWSGDNFYILADVNPRIESSKVYLSSGIAWSGDSFYPISN